MPLYMERDSKLDDRDFQSAAVGRDQIGAPMISLCFSPTGRDKFERLVNQNVTRWVIFLHEGKVLMAAKIMSGNTPECASIQGFVTAADAEAIQRAITGGH